MRDHFRGNGGQCPTEMAVACIIKNAFAVSGSDFGQHVRGHRAQTGPRDRMFGADFREVAACPIDKWRDAVGPDVFVHAVELRGSRNTETVFSKPRRHDFGVLVQEADMGGSGLAFLIVEHDGNRITFDRINIDAVAQ